jgi:DNA-binding NtrC family response regulator
MADILIVDDELGIRELLSEVLEDEGHSITLAENANQARAARAGGQHDTDGVTLLKEWNAAGSLTMPVVMMSGHATIDTAVEATRIGAFDFLEKPIALAKLLKTVQAALARAQAQKAWRAAVAQAQAQTAPAVVETLPAPDPLELAREALAQVDLDQPLREAREAFERIYLEYQLEKEGGSMTKLAERSGLERTHLYRKIRQLGMEPQKQSSRKAVA